MTNNASSNLFRSAQFISCAMNTVPYLLYFAAVLSVPDTLGCCKRAGFYRLFGDIATCANVAEEPAGVVCRTVVVVSAWSCQCIGAEIHRCSDKRSASVAVQCTAGVDDVADDDVTPSLGASLQLCHHGWWRRRSGSISVLLPARLRTHDTIL